MITNFSDSKTIADIAIDAINNTTLTRICQLLHLDICKNCSKIFIAYQKVNSDHTSRIYWYPRVLWVGIGCKRGTNKKLIEFSIKHTFETHNLALESIAGIATIDLKGNEVGIRELCQEYNYPLLTFTSDILSKIDVPNPSKRVNQEVKTPSVAEAACLAAASKFNIMRKTVSNGLLVSKQIVKIEGEKGAVTIAVAIAESCLFAR